MLPVYREFPFPGHADAASKVQTCQCEPQGCFEYDAECMSCSEDSTWQGVREAQLVSERESARGSEGARERGSEGARELGGAMGTRSMANLLKKLKRRL